MKRKALGRGLKALIPETTLDQIRSDAEQLLEISVDKIVPNRYQPRKNFSEEYLTDLANSIKVKGVIQPILVQKKKIGYELIAGERRWRAAKLLKLATIPAVVKKVTEKDLLELALIENIQREDLNPLEEAAAYQQLIDIYAYKQEEVAEAVGKNRSSVANFLRLLKLPEEIKQYVADKTLSMGHARAILGAPPHKQVELGHLIANKNLSVRETETLISKKKKKGKRDTASALSGKDLFLRETEGSLRKKFGTKVTIRTGKKGGKIEIQFYSDEELERICSVLKQ